MASTTSRACSPELELTFAEVTKLTIYLAGTSDFACVDRVCACRLTKPLPAVTRLEVCSASGGVPIAIEAIACRQERRERYNHVSRTRYQEELAMQNDNYQERSGRNRDLCMPSADATVPDLMGGSRPEYPTLSIPARPADRLDLRA